MKVPPLLHTEQVRYVIVGAWNTFFGLAVFAILLHLLGSVIGYPVVLLITQIVAVVQAHYAQRRLVWRSRGPFWPELLRFSTVYAVTYAANLAALVVMVEFMGWDVLLSQTAVTVVIVVITFLVNRHWTFRTRSGRSGAPHAARD